LLKGSDARAQRLKALLKTQQLRYALNRLRKKIFPRLHPVPAAAKKPHENRQDIAALKRCAKQNQRHYRVFQQPVKGIL
jgi:hypothetical protein